mgnify:CR=1 FL=1
MQDLGNTQYFKVTEPDNGVKIVLSAVYEALTEKGYTNSGSLTATPTVFEPKSSPIIRICSLITATYLS